jgi:hypothetical protein
MRKYDGRTEAEAEDLAEGVEPLTDAERKWIRRLESVLKAQPARLKMIEIADTIEVIDRAAGANVPLEDGNATRNGVFLCCVRHSVMKLTGVSG